ncbi:putative porin [Psychrosphaera haliotis]|nr:putative porin [Psychrosphaera haliotis]
MKTRALILSLSLLSSSAIANTYNNQVDVDYFSVESSNIIKLEGTHYLQSVSTNNTAWAEAAFIGRNTSVNVSYTDFDGDISNLVLGGDYYNNDLFFGLDVVYADVDGFDSDTSLVGEVGYFLKPNWMVSVAASEEDFSDTLVLSSKYIATLGDGQFVNFEVSYKNFDSDIVAAADYFWSPQSSIGVSLSSEESVNGTIRAQHFFTPSISARVEYVLLDGSDNGVLIGLTGRF